MAHRINTEKIYNHTLAKHSRKLKPDHECSCHIGSSILSVREEKLTSTFSRGDWFLSNYVRCIRRPLLTIMLP
jgi:hypothetical protein